MTCIWCLQSNIPGSIEHIIPESLGCPDDFIFKSGEVCRKCNNRLANIDRALLYEFEIIAFMNGVPRKGGKKPRIDSIPNLKARYINCHPEYHLNMESYLVSINDGRKVAPFKINNSSVDASIQREGGINKINFTQEVGKNNKLNRALSKIAFSSIAFYFGIDKVLNKKYDFIRKYVLYGGKCRPVILIMQNEIKYRHSIPQPLISSLDGSYYMEMTIAGVVFIVDLSPSLVNYSRIKKELESDEKYKGWWYSIPTMA